MTFLLVLGREPKISLAELEAIFSSSKVKHIAPQLALVTAHSIPLNRLGGTIKAAQILDEPIQDFLSKLPDGKITLGISDYSEHANPRKTWELALKYKNMLKRHGRNVRLHVRRLPPQPTWRKNQSHRNRQIRQVYQHFYWHPKHYRICQARPSSPRPRRFCRHAPTQTRPDSH